jgi:predicted aminopeptidase
MAAVAAAGDAAAGDAAAAQSQDRLDVLVLGVGAGDTCVYHKEPGSSFMLRLNGTPVLMLDIVSEDERGQHLKR